MPTITVVDRAAPTQTGQSAPGSDAKQRAIQALMGSTGNTQQTPVVNPSQVSVEERGATKTENTTAITEDTTSEQEAPQAAKEEPISSQYAILARKEKALRANAAKQEQTFKAREAALAAREAELTSKGTFDSSKYVSIDDLKRDAYRVLTNNGVTYDDISQQALASQSPEAQYYQRLREEMNQELQKVRDEQAQTRTAHQQQEAQAYQNALNQIRSEARQLVTSDPAFETIKETGSVNDVVDLIERTFKEDGTLMTVEQAAQAVEDYLVEEALKISKIKKIQNRLGVQAAKPAAKTQAPNPQEANNLKTLTNSVGNTRPLTAKERALLAFKGELAK